MIIISIFLKPYRISKKRFQRIRNYGLRFLGIINTIIIIYQLAPTIPQFLPKQFRILRRFFYNYSRIIFQKLFCLLLLLILYLGL